MPSRRTTIHTIQTTMGSINFYQGRNPTQIANRYTPIFAPILFHPVIRWSKLHTSSCESLTLFQSDRDRRKQKVWKLGIRDLFSRNKGGDRVVIVESWRRNAAGSKVARFVFESQRKGLKGLDRIEQAVTHEINLVVCGPGWTNPRPTRFKNIISRRL